MRIVRGDFSRYQEEGKRNPEFKVGRLSKNNLLNITKIRNDLGF